MRNLFPKIVIFLAGLFFLLEFLLPDLIPGTGRRNPLSECYGTVSNVLMVLGGMAYSPVAFRVHYNTSLYPHLIAHRPASLSCPGSHVSCDLSSCLYPANWVFHRYHNLLTCLTSKDSLRGYKLQVTG